ncbi:MAG: TCP-1/cpn60 chaperonin family protein [Candidatus Eiseniibacteriota bacterium]
MAVRAPFTGDRRRELLEDLAVMTGATVFARDVGNSLERVHESDLGRAARVAVDREHTTLLSGGGRTAAIRERIGEVERELKRAERKGDREWLRERLGRLTGGVAVIRVGAPTELAMTERRSRIEDALSATRAAIEEGVVVGGGVALLRAQPSVKALKTKGAETVGRDIVFDALEEPARQIADNAGAEGHVVVAKIREGVDNFGFDALTLRYCDLVEAGILDPTKVTRSALQHAASIGAMVLTTDAIVVEEEEEGEAED